MDQASFWGDKRWNSSPALLGRENDDVPSLLLTEEDKRELFWGSASSVERTPDSFSGTASYYTWGVSAMGNLMNRAAAVLPPLPSIASLYAQSVQEDKENQEHKTVEAGIDLDGEGQEPLMRDWQVINREPTETLGKSLLDVGPSVIDCTPSMMESVLPFCESPEGVPKQGLLPGYELILTSVFEGKETYEQRSVLDLLASYAREHLEGLRASFDFRLSVHLMTEVSDVNRKALLQEMSFEDTTHDPRKKVIFELLVGTFSILWPEEGVGSI